MNTKISIAVALLIATAGLTYLAFSNMGENLVYYWTPAELLGAGDEAQGAQVRLGGMVKKDSVDWDKEAQTLDFVVFDAEREVPVHSTGLPPQMFRENIGVVVEGQLREDGVFHATRMLVKHDNAYTAPHEGEKIDVKKLYESMEDGDS
ncbi:MAG: cytochrome c maturation protein CcmE [Myxococcota bacterium]|nr:cytochrome c maturation protein CcmE [Myxococcota bacterium]